MDKKTRESRFEIVGGVQVDVGDGQGPQPLYEIPTLGPFKNEWVFRWITGGVNIEIETKVPGVGLMTHYAYVPFSVKDQPGPVELQVTHTRLDWEDFRIGMTELQMGVVVDQITNELQSPEMRGWLPFLPPAGLATRRTGRRGKRPIDYAILAQKYVVLVENGNRRPNKALAEELNVGRKQVENLVSRCRDKGFLTSSPPGKAGGQLTDYCKTVLTEHSERP